MSSFEVLNWKRLMVLDLVPFANDDLDSSSRRTSLVDTDKTIVPDNGDVERDSTMVDGGGDTNDLSNEEASTLFHQGNVSAI